MLFLLSSSMESTMRCQHCIEMVKRHQQCMNFGVHFFPVFVFEIFVSISLGIECFMCGRTRRGI